jgi:hypothetical protein
MNRLSTAKRVQVSADLVECDSINAIVRTTGVAKHTVHVTCATEAGPTTYVWTLEELMVLVDSTKVEMAARNEKGASDGALRCFDANGNLLCICKASVLPRLTSRTIGFRCEEVNAVCL